MADAEKKVTDKLSGNGIDGKVVKDTLGRTFVLRQPDLLDQYDFVKALKEDANQSNLLAIMMPIMFIAKIDGEVFETPNVYSECRAALKRLKTEGITAIREAIEESGLGGEEAKQEIKK